MEIKKPNKFNARRCTFQGMTFDSKKEMERYLILKDAEKKGTIKNLECQVEYELLPACEHFRAVKYIADFRYKHLPTEEIITEDVKGMIKGSAYQLFKIKQKLVYNKYKILVKEI
jgi:hypothetical protein